MPRNAKESLLCAKWLQRQWKAWPWRRSTCREHKLLLTRMDKTSPSMKMTSAGSTATSTEATQNLKSRYAASQNTLTFWLAISSVKTKANSAWKPAFLVLQIFRAENNGFLKEKVGLFCLVASNLQDSWHQRISASAHETRNNSLLGIHGQLSFVDFLFPDYDWRYRHYENVCGGKPADKDQRTQKAAKAILWCDVEKWEFSDSVQKQQQTTQVRGSDTSVRITREVHRDIRETKRM